MLWYLCGKRFDSKMAWASRLRPFSWEANRFSASQEVPHTLWNPNFHHRFHKSLILRKLNLIYTPSVSYYEIIKKKWRGQRGNWWQYNTTHAHCMLDN